MGKKKEFRSDVKTHPFVVRLNDNQYSVIEGYAKQIGISMAEYIRQQAVFGKVEISYPIVVDFPQLEKLTNEFAAIGNNLNQIAQYFHLGGLQSKAMCEEINSCIAEIMKMRKDVMNLAGDFHGYYQTPVE